MTSRERSRDHFLKKRDEVGLASLLDVKVTGVCVCTLWHGAGKMFPAHPPLAQGLEPGILENRIHKVP